MDWFFLIEHGLGPLTGLDQEHDRVFQIAIFTTSFWGILATLCEYRRPHKSFTKCCPAWRYLLLWGVIALIVGLLAHSIDEVTRLHAIVLATLLSLVTWGTSNMARVGGEWKPLGKHTRTLLAEWFRDLLVALARRIDPKD